MNEVHLRLRSDSPSLDSVHPLTRAFGPRLLHHGKGRSRSNGLLTVSLIALACFSMAAETKQLNGDNIDHFKLRFRLLLISFLFAFLHQSMELRYYMISLFVPALVAVSSDVKRCREPSRYLAVAGVWFALFSPFLVPVYFWIRTEDLGSMPMVCCPLIFIGVFLHQPNARLSINSGAALCPSRRCFE
jgi:hypothetical protein